MVDRGAVRTIVPVEAIEALAASESALGVKVRSAVELLERAVQMYSAECLAFSFNGGKDCTVVLHLLRAAIARVNAKSAADGVGGGSGGVGMSAGVGEMSISQVQNVYFESEPKAVFQEVRDFMTETSRAYGLVYREFGSTYQAGLEDMVKEGLQAVVMGVRKGDPFSAELELLTFSSRGWPDFIRVNPVLYWTYSDVWDFIRVCGVEYCSLYDQGYSSLGQKHNTVPNPALVTRDSVTGSVTVRKASELVDGSLERDGRPNPQSQL